MVKKKPAAPARSTVARRKAEKAKAEEFIDTAKAKAVKKVAAKKPAPAPEPEKKTRAKRKEPWANITKEQILEAREGLRLSWRDVANKLDLGSPSTARKAYTALTGKPHTESEVLVKRAPRGTNDSITGKRATIITRPEWDDWTLDEDLEAQIKGRTLIVERNGREEELRVSTGMEMIASHEGARKGKTSNQYREYRALVHGIRTRNRKGEPVAPYFCFTEAGTTNARTVTVDQILAVR